MSDKSENLKRPADMSEFEAEFDGGDHFAVLWKEEKEQETLAAQLLRQEQETSRQQAIYKRAMAEKELSHKSPLDKLRHLKDAYNAASYLKTVDALPSPDVFDRLQDEIREVQAIIAQRNTANDAD